MSQQWVVLVDEDSLLPDPPADVGIVHRSDEVVETGGETRPAPALIVVVVVGAVDVVASSIPGCCGCGGEFPVLIVVVFVVIVVVRIVVRVVPRAAAVRTRSFSEVVRVVVIRVVIRVVVHAVVVRVVVVIVLLQGRAGGCHGGGKARGRSEIGVVIHAVVVSTHYLVQLQYAVS